MVPNDLMGDSANSANSGNGGSGKNISNVGVSNGINDGSSNDNNGSDCNVSVQWN